QSLRGAGGRVDVGDLEPFVGVIAGRALNEETSFGICGHNSRLRKSLGDLRSQLAPRHLLNSLSPPSWRARSSAASASTTSSSSPSRTRSRECKVRPTRWSVTRFSLKLYVRIFSDRPPPLT